MKQITLALLLLLLLAHSYGSPAAQYTGSSAKALRNSHAARQLAPYPAAGYSPKVPFKLPTDQAAEAPSDEVTTATATQLEAEDDVKTDVEAAEDLAEDVDPIAADAAEDDTEPLPAPEARVNSKGDEEQDENADVIPESAAGATPSKRYWFFRK